jgi:cytochrome b pre-mRNA-processing protein 3
MGLLKTLFGRADDPRDALRPLYHAVIVKAREPFWYAKGGVPDSLDGRFDMIAVVLSMVLARLERGGGEGAAQGARLTELFVDDMDPQLREIGIGDMVVGKHIGRMMGALGGRLGAYRDAFTFGGALDEALIRNLYRGVAPAPAALATTATQLRILDQAIAAQSLDDLLAGRLTS